MVVQVQGGLTQGAIAQLNHPFANSHIVYVLKNGDWREAFIQQVRGRLSQGLPAWTYRVQYLDQGQEVENGVEADRLRTIEQAQRQGLTDNVYDLSTQAGIAQILAAHNQARQAVGVPDLAWSGRLATSAQTWADRLLAENRFEHSPPSLRANGWIGENLATRRSSAPGGSLFTPRRAVQGWVDERADYDYASNSCTPGKMCGHYRQMVWSTTTEVGCGVARDGHDRREVWVCHYSPAGNIVGRRPY
ncbi:hypothetical protein C7271_08540 [filamentous cyanobacterium CCP5]|nr:hypothetical protein C7271_08540 [filamentous cyanobacterium CCP5]